MRLHTSFSQTQIEELSSDDPLIMRCRSSKLAVCIKTFNTNHEGKEFFLSRLTVTTWIRDVGFPWVIIRVIWGAFRSKM